MKNLTSISDHSDYLEKTFTFDAIKWDLHRKRVEFGKQPLAIWMFVPCDEDGNVLEEPIECDCQTQYDRECCGMFFNCEEYKKAKERCLFEGFTIKTYNTEEYDNIEAVIKYNHCYVGIKYKDEGKIRLNDISQKETIEHLIPNELQLTPTAIKTLGL